MSTDPGGDFEGEQGTRSGSSGTYSYLGKSYMRKNQFHKAQEAYEKQIEMDRKARVIETAPTWTSMSQLPLL